jgi:hypothetical protein
MSEQAWVTADVTEHVGMATPLVESHYDATSQADLGRWAKLEPGGPADLVGGERTGEGFDDSGPFWKQV